MQRPRREFGLLDAFSVLASAPGLRVWFAVVMSVLSIGTAGYMLLERWNFGDALYMTVISMTTAGFREVQALDDAGRIWTMLLEEKPDHPLALLNLGGIAYTAGDRAACRERWDRFLRLYPDRPEAAAVREKLR